jgi:cellobiose transport system permease protein
VPGGVFRQYQTTVLYLWDMAFNRGNFGKAAAIAWLLFLIIVVIGILNFLLSRRIASAETRIARRRTRRRLEALAASAAGETAPATPGEVDR